MPRYDRLFQDRAEAGRRLARALAERRFEDPIIYALPRGGVPVAVEVAKALDAPLDLLTGAGRTDRADPEEARGCEPDVIERRRRAYLDGRGRPSPEGRTAIVVDDGLTTGARARAALEALRRRGARRIVLAVPVGSVETLAEMGEEADEIVCATPAGWFAGVAGFYQDFHPLDDAETLAWLAQVWTPGERPGDRV